MIGHLCRLLLLAGLGGLLWLLATALSGQPAAAGSRCRPDDPNRASVHTFTRVVPTVLAGGRVRLDLDLTLRSAPRPLSFRLLPFVGPSQIDVGEAATILDLDCGETRSLQLELAPERLGTLNLFFRQLPAIPRAIRSGEPLTATELLHHASPFTPVETRLLAPAPAFDPGAGGGIEVRYRSAAVRQGYLFMDDPEAPVYRHRTDASRIDFGLFFSEVSADPSGLYTLTCMVNDEQIPAFAGQTSWSGPIRPGEGVVLRGQAELPAVGWHHLSCVALNSLYAASGEVSDYPHAIAGMFVLRTP